MHTTAEGVGLISRMYLFSSQQAPTTRGVRSTRLRSITETKLCRIHESLFRLLRLAKEMASSFKMKRLVGCQWQRDTTTHRWSKGKVVG